MRKRLVAIGSYYTVLSVLTDVLLTVDWCLMCKQVVPQWKTGTTEINF